MMRGDLKRLNKEELIALLMDVAGETSSLQTERDTYKSERDDYKTKLEHAYTERDRLRAIIVKLERHQFGRRSERLSPDQLQLALEDLAQTLAAIEAKDEVKSGQSTEGKGAKQENKAREPRNNNRGALPEHLPREHRFIEPEEKVCPCCNGALHVIGEETSQQLADSDRSGHLYRSLSGHPYRPMSGQFFRCFGGLWMTVSRQV
jgi:hypothetical protein